MIADTIEELHESAKRIGLKREWFQIGGGKLRIPHYDLSPSMRSRALSFGARYCNRKEFTELMLKVERVK